MRRFSILFIALSLALSACGTLEISLATPPPEIPELPPGSDLEPTPEPGLSLTASSEEIQRLMLESASTWKTIWMDGTVTYFAIEGTGSHTTTIREQVWIDLTASRFRILTGPAAGTVETFKVSDGMTVLEMDVKTGQSLSHPLPDLGPEKQFVPAFTPGYASPQPLWGQIGTPVSQLAFPSDFAQSEGVFKPLTLESVAGRDTLVVEWTYAQNNLPSWRLWLDTETAVILKIQTFDKEGGKTVRSEAVVDQVAYGDIFADDLFRAPSALPVFSDVAGSPLASVEPAPTASSDPDPLHEVYFFVSDHNYGNEKVQLVQVPGSCAAGMLPCPEAEAISTPFGLRFSLTSLVWSPAGDAAALAYPVSDDGNRSALFLFDPQTHEWRSLAEFNFIDPPFWSPDGHWLAFRVQDGQGSDEIYVVRRDGSGLIDLSTSEELPADGAPYALSGWINNHAVLHSRSNGTIYLVRAGEQSVTPLFDTPLAKSDLVVPSPDGYFLAYTEASDQAVALKLLTPDGKTARELAAFPKTSLYPITWSPDARSLAFAAMTDARDPAAGQDVYIIGSDGQGLQRVYHSRSGSLVDLVFSPDAGFLLFQDDDPAGRHIFSIDLSTLQPHMLQVPNLPLDWWWLAPSWR